MTVIVETNAGVTTVTINRPEARNAVNPQTAQALYDAFLAFEAEEDAQVAVLTGAGGAFCAGFDLKAAGSGAADGWIGSLGIPEGWNDPMSDPRPGPMGPSRLMLTKPLIAAIEGAAVAGGMELAAWCDMRVMEDDATFGVFCRRWGVPLIDGGTVRLPRIIGQGRALDMILTGRPVDAAEALSIGLANRVVPDGAALDAAIALAREIAAFPQICMRTDRASAHAQWSMPMAEALANEGREGAKPLLEEAAKGAARFRDGAGRGGRFGE